MVEGPFRGTDALTAGVLTRHQLHGSRFRRVFPDVYVPVGLAMDLATRSRCAYLWARDRGGTLAGYSAAALLGADCAAPDAPAEVVITVRGHPCPRLRVYRDQLDATDVTTAAGCRTTTPARTAWDLARRLPLVEAVVTMDALARCGGFVPTDLLARRAECPGARGCRKLDEVVRLADPRAESPPETRLRLALVRAGLPRPEVQYRIIDEYGFVLARVDLAYPAARLAIEYDGAPHYSRYRGELDRERDAELADHGWHTMRLGRDTAYTPQTIERIRSLLTVRTSRNPVEWHLSPVPPHSQAD